MCDGLIERENAMQIGNKELVVIGDRVLVKREDLEERTKVGLYLPQTVVEKEEVQSGRIMATGPGLPLPETPEDDEPWRNSPKEPRYLPLQVEEGDFALFLQKAAMEISFEGEKYLIVPQASILVVIRESETIVGEDEVLDELEGLDDLDL